MVTGTRSSRPHLSAACGVAQPPPTRDRPCNSACSRSATAACGARRPSTCRAFVRRAADLGYDAVMLAGKRPHLSPLDFDPAAVAALRDDLTTAKVQCAVVAAYTDLSPAAAAEVPFAGDADRLRRVAVPDRRRRSGPASSACSRPTRPPGQTPHAAWQRVVAALREMCDRAAAHGITIAVQNHHDVALHTDALLELLARRRPPELQARVRRLVAGPARRGPVRGGEAGGPAHGDHHERGLRPAAAVPLPAGAGELRAGRARTWCGRSRSAPGSSTTRRSSAGLRDGGFDGLATYEMCSPVRGGGGSKTSTSMPAPTSAGCGTTGCGSGRAGRSVWCPPLAASPAARSETYTNR